MKYPKGAIRSLEEMEKCLGKPVYMVLPPHVGAAAPRPHPWIIKITPIDIDMKSHPKGLTIITWEKVIAARDHGIDTEKDLTVTWGYVGHRRYYFPNFWHAYAHYLKQGEA